MNWIIQAYADFYGVLLGQTDVLNRDRKHDRYVRDGGRIYKTPHRS